MIHKNWVLSGIILLALAIILGAFGAHGLKPLLTLEQLNSFEVGVRYQTYIGLAFIAISPSINAFQLTKKTSFSLILAGVILFSGSIYALTLSHLLGFPMIRKIAGPITPIGGLLMIIGWLFVFIHVYKFSKKP